MFATICVHTTSACKRAGMVQPSNLLSAGGQAQSLATRNRHARAPRQLLFACCDERRASGGVGWKWNHTGSDEGTLENFKQVCVCVCVCAQC